MRLVSIQNCQSGMKLAKPIYDKKGRILLGEGVVLTESLINFLKNRKVITLYIRDKNFEDIELIDSIPIEVRVEANNTIQETFKDLMDGNGKRGKRIKELKIDKVKKSSKCY